MEILLDPKRPQDVELQIAFDPGVTPGTVAVFDLITRDRSNDEIIGGARMLAVAV